MKATYPLNVLTLHLDRESPNLQVYKKAVLEFSSMFGMVVNIEGNFLGYPYIDSLFDILAESGIDNVRVRVDNLTEDMAKLLKEKSIKAVLFRVYKFSESDKNIVGYNKKNEDIKKGILICKKYSLPMEISVLISRENLNDIDKYIKFSKENNAILLNFTRDIFGLAEGYNVTRLSPEEYKNLLYNIQSINNSNSNSFKISFSHCPYKALIAKDLEVEKGIMGGCSGGIVSLEILENGDAVICYPLKKLALANISNRSLKDIWSNHPILAKLRDRKNLKGKCGKCDFTNLCGGCRAAAFIDKGDLFEEDKTCFRRIR